MDKLNLGEEVVFDEVVNEVSIVDDEHNKNQQNLITVQTTSSTAATNDNQFIQQTIKSPVINTGQVASIRSVKPNTKSTTTSSTTIGLLPISPAKPQTPNKSTTKTIPIRPKPANITIQSPTNQSTDKQQHFQIIRLISAANTSNTTNSTITTAGLKQIAGAQATGQQKVLIPASALKGLNASQLLNQTTSSTGGQQFLIYATTPTAQLQIQSPAPTPITPNQNGPKGTNNAANTSVDHDLNKSNQLAVAIPSTSTQQSAIVATAGSSNRPRKPCNCTRSQCLKLYCDCFANGEFCSNCNCINCFNNLDHEENRQKAIKQCLERNPHAFHPKIGKGKTTAQEGIERRHTKGCNCRRSGCLKNYCECYEAKILCTDLCKCCACKNYEDSYERKSLMHLVDAVDIRSSLHSNAGTNFVGKENDPLWSNEFRPKLPVPFISNRLISCSFITNDLVDATTQCLIAQAEKSQKLGLTTEETERAIIEEFGNCLTQIIEVANKEKHKEK